MQTPLIDPEGFPRSDIDVAGVRTARVQIIRLRNDLKDCMSEMETLVQRGLGKSDESAVQEGQEEMKDEEEETGSATEGRKPFAKVDGVFPGGPADAAVSSGDSL